MKNLLWISLLLSIVISQQTTSYSWEDGTGTILGSYGNLSNPANVGTTSGVSPYDGSRMLTVSESPIDGTPQAFIAWVTDLSAGQSITACFYGFDDTPGSSPSLRVWGSWSANNNINDYQGSADGNNEYTDGSGWSQICHTFSTNQENWNSGEALVVQARLYSGSNDPTVYFIDEVEITAPNSATVHYPGSGSSGCTDPIACNYNPYVTEDDGSCVYPTEMSICEIQYTTDQGQYCYESDYAQTCVKTTGTVTAKSPLYPNFYIQDEACYDLYNGYNGIYVHGYSASPPSFGQNITITAMVNEYYSFTQLTDGASYTINSSNNSVSPKDISTGDLSGLDCWTAETGEALEGTLVRISNLFVSTSCNGFGEWYVNDGTGEVMINDTMFDGEDWPCHIEGCQMIESITGVVEYAYGEYSILPRNMSDINYGNFPVAHAGDDQTVEPTDLVSLIGTDSYDPNGSILYEWNQEGTGTAVTLQLENESTAYFYAPSTQGVLQFRLTIFDSDQNESCDDVKITVGACVPISSIQLQENQGTYCFESDSIGVEVNLCPAIVTSVNSGEYPNFFIQQEGVSIWSGMYVFDTSVDPQVGDALDLTATVNEYYSFTQLIDVTSYATIASGFSINPEFIHTGDLGIDCNILGERYESMLVRVSNVTVESIDEFGNIAINDGSGSTLMDDYYYDGTFPTYSPGDNITSIIGNVGYSYSEFKIYPRNIDDIGNCLMGDINFDGGHNVLDIVTLANCVLADNCDTLDNACAADMNGDNGYNVLDIVALANCILDNNCGGRIDDASHSKLIIEDNMVSIRADGFIGGVQMTLSHEADFKIEMTNYSLHADYLTNGNQTRLLVINPETENLFDYSGNFEIVEIIVANTQYEISVDLPKVFSLSEAYPNPFNPTTTMTLTTPLSGKIKIEVYNLMGQQVATLISGYMQEGSHQLTWDASNVSSGLYLVKAQADGFKTTRKLMLIK